MLGRGQPLRLLESADKGVHGTVADLLRKLADTEVCLAQQLSRNTEAPACQDRCGVSPTDSWNCLANRDRDNPASWASVSMVQFSAGSLCMHSGALATCWFCSAENHFCASVG